MASDDDGSCVVGSVDELMEVAGSTWPICYSRTRNAADADDAVAETQFAAHMNSNKLVGRPRYEAEAWCSRVARYKSIDIVRRRRWRPGLSDDIQAAADKLVPMPKRSTTLDPEELLEAFVQANADDPDLAGVAEYYVAYSRSNDGNLPTSTNIGEEFFGSLKRAQRFERAKRVQTRLYLNTIRFLRSQGFELPPEGD